MSNKRGPLQLLLRKNSPALQLQDIGTSEEEIERLVFVARKKSATEALESLRRGARYLADNPNARVSPFPNHVLVNIRVPCKMLGFTYQDIGTSEKEVRELFAVYARVYCPIWLEILRSGWTILFPNLTKSIRYTLNASGLTPVDIGSSEDELASFKEMWIEC